MRNGIHFISGLPRSGPTLLAAILRQNPRFHAGMSSPVAMMFGGLLRQMSQENEFALQITNRQREAVLRGMMEAFYAEIHPTQTVFDTSRNWTTKLAALTALFPQSRMICCVRDVPWIIDSVERLVRTNRFEPSRIFGFEPGGTVYTRADSLSAPTGMLGHSWHALREAYYSEQADRLLLLRYETLTSRPDDAMAAIYAFLGEAPFPHDFNNVCYDADEFDRRLGAPGLHRVAQVVRPPNRATILPPDLIVRYQKDNFWDDPALNLRKVRLV